MAISPASTRRTGEVRWQKNLRRDFDGTPGMWAYAESPLIDGDTLVCTPGGKTATLVALDKKSGNVFWKSPVEGADQAAYASVIIVTTGGVKQYVQFLAKGLVGVDAKTGKFLWRYDKTGKGPANIPTAVAYQNYVYSALGPRRMRPGRAKNQGPNRPGRRGLLQQEASERHRRSSRSRRLSLRNVDEADGSAWISSPESRSGKAAESASGRSRLRRKTALCAWRKRRRGPCFWSSARRRDTTKKEALLAPESTDSAAGARPGPTPRLPTVAFISTTSARCGATT